MNCLLISFSHVSTKLSFSDCILYLFWLFFVCYICYKYFLSASISYPNFILEYLTVFSYHVVKFISHLFCGLSVLVLCLKSFPYSRVIKIIFHVYMLSVHLELLDLSVRRWSQVRAQLYFCHIESSFFPYLVLISSLFPLMCDVPPL